MVDDTMTTNLQALVFNGKEEERPEFIVKFQAFLVIKGCTEMIQTNLKSRLHATENEELDATTELRKAKKLVEIKNAMVMVYVTQCLSGMAMLNAIFNVRAEAGLPTGRACQLFDNLKQKYNPNDRCK